MMTLFSDGQIEELRKLENQLPSGSKGTRFWLQFVIHFLSFHKPGADGGRALRDAGYGLRRYPDLQEVYEVAENQQLLPQIQTMWDMGVGSMRGYKCFWRYQLAALRALPDWFKERPDAASEAGYVLPVLVDTGLPVYQLATLLGLGWHLRGEDPATLSPCRSTLEWKFIKLEQGPRSYANLDLASCEEATTLHDILCLLMQHVDVMDEVAAAGSIYEDAPYRRVPVVTRAQTCNKGVRCLYADHVSDSVKLALAWTGSP